MRCSSLRQEHGAAVGLLEQADVVGDGPGEGALAVAEELAFQQTD
jgi:hypothetical protein